MAAAAPPPKKGPAPEITLRPFQLSDVDYLLAWMGDDRVSHYTAWDTLTTREEALDYLKNTILPHPCFRAVCVDGGRPVGYVSVRPRTGTKRCRGRASCSLAREYWGRGIAAAAVRMVAAEAFRDFPELERVEALVDEGNVGAQTTLEKAGFVREGVHRRFYVRKGRSWDMIVSGGTQQLQRRHPSPAVSKIRSSSLLVGRLLSPPQPTPLPLATTSFAPPPPSAGPCSPSLPPPSSPPPSASAPQTVASSVVQALGFLALFLREAPTPCWPPRRIPREERARAVMFLLLMLSCALQSYWVRRESEVLEAEVRGAGGGHKPVMAPP